MQGRNALQAAWGLVVVVLVFLVVVLALGTAELFTFRIKTQTPVIPAQAGIHAPAQRRCGFPPARE
ncbi:MAG: hypothetical protein KA511_04685 [Brachymonas sp.]|nr:hypothetical protein [Brachymonas sp.]